MNSCDSIYLEKYRRYGSSKDHRIKGSCHVFDVFLLREREGEDEEITRKGDRTEG